MTSGQTPSNTQPIKSVPLNPFGANNGLLNITKKQSVKTTNEVSTANFSGTIDLEIKSRNARKSITFVKGLETSDLDLNKLATEWRKKFCCSVANDNGVIKLSGDRREAVVEYLTEKNIVKEEQIKVHGY